MHKYNVNSKRKDRTIDGLFFDSLAEMDRYLELKILQRAGKISGLSYQPCFEIIPKTKRVKRARVYTADFAYIENEKTIVEDVKGFITTDYKLRRDLFLNLYTEVVFREIHRGIVKEFPNV